MAPGSSTIATRQDEPRTLLYLAAARQRYADRRRAHCARLAGTVSLAVASPIVVIFTPSLGPWLGAAAGLWVLIGRVLLQRFETRAVDDGRRLQEEFDVRVFDLPANPALGRRPVAEAALAASARVDSTDALRGWYPAKGLDAEYRSVLICQRSNVAWGNRLHRGYAWLLGTLTSALILMGLVVSIIAKLSLSDYLVLVFLPGLPAMLDGIDLVNEHNEASKAKGQMETDLTVVLRDASPVAVKDCRSFQDRIFMQRGLDPVISDLYYRLRRKSYERYMFEAANLIRGED